MPGPFDYTGPHYGVDPHPFQDPNQSPLDAANRPPDMTGQVDPNAYHYQGDFDAAVDQANRAALDNQRRAEQALRAPGYAVSPPSPNPQQLAAAQASLQREADRVHRLATYCQSPEMHKTSRCNRAAEAGGVALLCALPALLLFLFGAALLHLPAYNFSQFWNGGGNAWATTLCVSIIGLAWARVAFVERRLNAPTVKHLKTCQKPLEPTPSYPL